LIYKSLNDIFFANGGFSQAGSQDLRSDSGSPKKLLPFTEEEGTGGDRLRITVDDIDDLAAGAVVLGAGGGGDPHLLSMIVRAALRRHGPVRLVPAADLDPDGLILPVALIGAPMMLGEKLFHGGEFAAAVSTFERFLGRDVVGVMPIEVGGTNTLVPIAAAAALGLPVVDADAMRRAFSSVHLTQLTLAGISASPMVLVDSVHNTVVLRGVDNESVERLARATTREMGMLAVSASYPITGRQAVTFAIPGSLSYCLHLGGLVRAYEQGNPDAYQSVLDFCGGQIIFTGKVADLHRRTELGRQSGTVVLEHAQEGDRFLRIDFQDENLLAIEDGVALVTVPDLISVLDTETGVATATESLELGQLVDVLAIPAHDRWRQPDGIELVGPRAFGYDVDYVPFGSSR
jgi:uncharacterized protein